MAQGVAAGVGRAPGTKAVLKKVGAVSREGLLVADAIVIGSPVHMGNAAIEVRRACYCSDREKVGVGGGIRTLGHWNHNPALYQLSYTHRMAVSS